MKILQHLAQQGCQGIGLIRSGQTLHFQSKLKKIYNDMGEALLDAY
jgi:hypothetical protein